MGVRIGHVELNVPPAIQDGGGTPSASLQPLPHLPTLNHKLTQHLRDGDHDRYIRLQWDLAALPYCLAATRAALVSFMEASRQLIADNERSLERGTTLLLNSEATYPVNFAIDAFLDAARRTQNALTIYISRALDAQLPRSYSDLAKAIEKGKHRLPLPLEQLVMDYWRLYGEHLKHYRDIAQHHTLVASNSRLFRGEDGRLGIFLLLPSNPEVKDASKLVFGNPHVHAQRFLREQFKHLLAMSYWITKVLLNALPGESAQQVGFYPREELEVGAQLDGHCPMSAEELDADIQQILNRIHNLPLPQLVM